MSSFCGHERSSSRAIDQKTTCLVHVRVHRSFAAPGAVSLKPLTSRRDVAPTPSFIEFGQKMPLLSTLLMLTAVGCVRVDIFSL